MTTNAAKTTPTTSAPSTPMAKTTTPTTTTKATTPARRRWTRRLRRLLQSAVQAPSSHNSQPWLVRMDENVLELLPDRRRGTPVVDPEDRELALSCGAFLFHLRMAARHEGLTPHITLLPQPDDAASADLGLDRAAVFARVVFSDDNDSDLYEEQLFAAIGARHSWRLPFAPRPVDDVRVAQLISAAAVEGCRLAVVAADDDRAALASLVSTGDREQWADPAFRAELATWLHAARAGRDGVAADALGTNDLVARFAGGVVRTFDLGGARAAHDRALADGSPLLCVLLSDGDRERDWLQAGQALDRVLLTATSHALASSFLQQPIERPALRAALQRLLKTSAFPQAVLRIGFPDRAPPPPSSRRRVDEILLPGPVSMS